jgi:hypothetical protein
VLRRRLGGNQQAADFPTILFVQLPPLPGAVPLRRLGNQSERESARSVGDISCKWAGYTLYGSGSFELGGQNWRPGLSNDEQ